MRDSRPHVVLFWFMDDWGKYGRTYEHVARELARSNEIARVTCILPPVWEPLQDSRPPLRMREWSRKLVAVTPQPHILPAGFRPQRLRQWVNSHLANKSLAALLHLYGYRRDNTLLWLFPPHPYAQILRNMIPHRYQLLHVIDNNALTAHGDETAHGSVRAQYLGLAEQSTRIFVNSELNLEWFSSVHPQVSFFENAVDPIFFCQPRLCRTKPRLAYLGWVTERTDVSILERLADHRRNWEIHLAAPDNQKARHYLQALLDRPNVRWVRDSPCNKAPQFLSDADVCLMPHLDTPYSRSMSPLKLLQYLASSRPVVSTRVAGVDRWAGHVSIANTPDEFIQAVESVLLNDTLEAAQARIAAMQTETWQHRVQAMLEPVLNDWRNAGNTSQTSALGPMNFNTKL
jgi:glycosyltransferase involved in cell wall biosynthesis